jgi:2,4-dienoyl-CoA reductase-like NADH-dependent reductase (Old Yellow Enzyme family)
MARYRCGKGFIATDKTREYYESRADAALIFTCPVTVSEDSP